MHINIANETIFINHEDGALRITILRSKNAIKLGNMAVRIEITQERVGDASHAFCPGSQTCTAVDAETQHLGLDPIKPVKAGLVRWNLACSYRRPGQWKKSQDDIFLADKITQADFFPQVAIQAKIGGGLTNS